MELRDKNGLTEREYLAAYDPDRHPRPSVTADIAIFAREGEALRLLLIHRGGHPFMGRLALPGGFADRNEAVEQTAARELMEETSVTGVPLTLVGVFSAPGRDPRGWVITAAFRSVVDASAITVRAGDDAADAAWYDIAFDREGDRITLSREGDSLTITGGNDDGGRLAFDHAKIIAAAVQGVL